MEFEPRVGAIGSRVVLKGFVPEGAQARFGTRTVTLLREPGGGASFLVPSGASTSFIELVRGGKTLGKSAVPYVVSGTSLVSAPKLIGLKEAIDVFGYADPRPEGGEKPETPVRPVLTFDDAEILTIGEPSPPPPLQPAVLLGDAASAATRGMGPAGFLITARPPRKKLVVPTPPPN